MKTATVLGSALLLFGAVTLNAVEYGGEKSYMIQIPYTACVVPPQVDDAMAKGVKVVSVKDAKKLYDEKAVFFDARAKRHYEMERIKGAHPVIFDLSKASYIALQLPEDKDTAIVFYCYGESCADSYEAALAARKAGYTNVSWLLNGFPEWKASGYPTETGE